MSTDVAIRGFSDIGFPQDEDWQAMSAMASALMASGLFRGHKTKEAIIGVMLKGRYLKVDPVWAVERIHPIPGAGGKITLSIDGQGMLALIRRDGSVTYHVNHPDEDTAKCSMKRNGDDEPTVITWTKRDAQNAGLYGKDNWKKYPKTMLRWRAIVDCARIVCPDLISGMYLADEMGAETDEDGAPIYEDGEVVVNNNPVEPEHEKMKERAESVEYTPVNEKKTEAPTFDSLFPEDDNKYVPPPEPEPVPPPATEQKPEPQGNAQGKKYSQNIQVQWGTKMRSLGVALGKAIEKDVSLKMFMKWLSKFDISHEDVIGEDGKPHLSDLPISKLELVVNSYKDVGLINELTGYYNEITGSPEVAYNSKPNDEPQAEEKPTIEQPVASQGQSDTDELAEEVKKLQEMIEQQAGPEGIRLHVTILKNNGIVQGAEKTMQMLLDARAQLTDAYRDLLLGEKSMSELMDQYKK